MKPSQSIAFCRCISKQIRLTAALTAFVGATQVFAAHLTVSTINDLKNTNPTSTNDVVNVVDYYDRGVGDEPDRGRGGGLFRAVPVSSYVPLSCEDGGRYIRHNTNTVYIWERDFQGQVPNVKMWGATGNGTTNDTVAIQKAVGGVRGNSAWYNLSRAAGNELLFPSGTYLISDTIIIPGEVLIRGEGAFNASTVQMSSAYGDRDIFRTVDADYYIKGWALGSPAYPDAGSWYYNIIAGDTNIIGFNPLRIQDLAFSYGTYSSNHTGAAICMTLPLETSEIKNISTWGGGYGVRVIGPGAPGVRIHNSGFFNQAIASVCIEGLRYRTNSGGADFYAASGHVATLSSLSGDSFDAGQAAQNSFLLFTNVTPMATITDLSIEGAYGRGAIRCVLNSNATSPAGYINVRSGTWDGAWKPAGIVNDLVVLQNPHTSTSFRMPTVSAESFYMYGVRNIISDEWQPRFIPAPASFNDYLPVRRALHYTSGITHSTSERRSLLVYGDTAYYSFIPTTTGWKRVLLSYGSDQVFGGKLAINSPGDSSEFSFNLAPFSNLLTVTRTSRNWGGGYAPCVSKVRGYTFWQGSAYREAIDIYVDSILSTSLPPEMQAINLTLPLEGRVELNSGLSNLVAPVDLESNSANATPNPTVSGETYGSGSTGVISLLR